MSIAKYFHGHSAGGYPAKERLMMVLVLDSNRNSAEEACVLIRSHGHQARILNSWKQLKTPGPQKEVLLINLDTMETDDRQLRNITRRDAFRVVMTMSAVPHHPHLSESMQQRVFAALSKPLDPDELGFWLKSIQSMKENGSANHEGITANDH